MFTPTPFYIYIVYLQVMGAYGFLVFLHLSCCGKKDSGEEKGGGPIICYSIVMLSLAIWGTVVVFGPSAGDWDAGSAEDANFSATKIVALSEGQTDEVVLANNSNSTFTCDQNMSSFEKIYLIYFWVQWSLFVCCSCCLRQGLCDADTGNESNDDNAMTQDALDAAVPGWREVLTPELLEATTHAAARKVLTPEVLAQFAANPDFMQDLGEWEAEKFGVSAAAHDDLFARIMRQSNFDLSTEFGLTQSTHDETFDGFDECMSTV